MATIKAVNADQLDADLASVADHIREKGGTFEPLEFPSGYNAAIDAIQTGVELPALTNPGTAADLRQGKQLIDADGKTVDGELVEVAVAEPTISVAASGAVTAAVEQAAGITGGGRKTKSLQQEVIGAQTITPGTTDQTIPAYRYLTGKQTIKGDANLTPENIVSGVSIFDVKGTAETGAAPKEEPPSRDVDFYDYDGTRLYSYTLDEVQAMTELPPLPSRPGLVCQGWNWTLDNIKAQADIADVGALYVTDDGKTRFYISIQFDTALTVPLNIYQSSANGVSIDWGDGSALETIDGSGSVSTSHTYAQRGDYIISLDVLSGTINAGHGVSARLFGAEAKHNSLLRRVECGANFLTFARGALQGQTALLTISVSSDISEFSQDALHDCFGLQCLVLSHTTSLSAYTLYGCGSLRALCLGDRIAPYGGNATIYDCRALQRYARPKYTAGEFVSNNFAVSCQGIQKFVLSTDASGIGSAAFRNCKSLREIVVPSSVGTIGSNAFATCTAMRRIRFDPTVPPTVENANAFTGIPTDCVVEVLADSLAAYQAATNYSGIAAQMVGV